MKTKHFYFNMEFYISRSHQAVYSNWYQTACFLGLELTRIYHHHYGYCDIVVYNKKQIFGLHPHSLVMTAIKVSLLG